MSVTTPSGPPIKPRPPCGGTDEPPCPPVDAIVQNGGALYTVEQMHEHGTKCFNAGRMSKTLKPTSPLPAPIGPIEE